MTEYSGTQERWALGVYLHGSLEEYFGYDVAELLLPQDWWKKPDKWSVVRELYPEGIHTCKVIGYSTVPEYPLKAFIWYDSQGCIRGLIVSPLDEDGLMDAFEKFYHRKENL
jgi:hypothetical protein